MVGWVFFRADTLQQAVAYLSAMAGMRAPGLQPFDVAWFLTPEVSLALAAGVVGSAPVVPALVRAVDRSALSEAEVAWPVRGRRRDRGAHGGAFRLDSADRGPEL